MSVDRLMRIVSAVWLIGMLMLPFSTAGAAPADESSYVARVLDLTNAARANAGLNIAAGSDS